MSWSKPDSQLVVPIIALDNTEQQCYMRTENGTWKLQVLTVIIEPLQKPVREVG